MKKGLQYLAVLLIVLIAVVCFAVFFAVPKAAAISLPYRWNRIPVGQKSWIVYQYLGKPVNGDSSFILKKDEWYARRDNGEYVLTVFYNSDTIANSYQLVFNYRLGFFHKTYLLNSQ